jgi:type I restriction enzyme M protein
LAEKELEGKISGRRSISKIDFQAKGVIYLPPQARSSTLLQLPKVRTMRFLKSESN